MAALKNSGKRILAFFMSAVFIFLIFWNLDFNQLVLTFKTFNYKVLFLFVPLYIFSLFIRGVRWKLLLYEKNKAKISQLFLAFATGTALNITFPARFGDFWRAYQIGEDTQENKAKILGSIILERITDGISVIFVLMFAILMYSKNKIAVTLIYSASAFFAASLILIFILLRLKKIKEKFPSFIKPLIEGFEALNHHKHFTAAMFISLCVRFIECLMVYLLIIGFAQPVAFSLTFFVITFVALSSMIPSVSTQLGAYQYAYVLAFGLYNIDKASALGIAFINQATIIAVLTIITIFYLNLNNLKINNISETVEE